MRQKSGTGSTDNRASPKGEASNHEATQGPSSVNPPRPLRTRQPGQARLHAPLGLNGAAAQAARTPAAHLLFGGPISNTTQKAPPARPQLLSGHQWRHRLGSPRRRAPNRLRPRPSASTAS
ncbi:hypothetical protein NDU88_006332 [Pleurodeles waltl]|uniref:Uncharacterized protein n=1 Tax=Pleurodeles waltl TaxID=8319 RepID=A0AAV7NQ07_PLEWA|nr:hypothetical protein NDU88_006332 [Pleurodeles waltl]